MVKRTTHVRVSRELLEKKRNLFPEYKPDDIFKIGLTTCMGMKTTGEFLYGKDNWKKIIKKK